MKTFLTKEKDSIHLQIINHPGYDEEKGPIEGFDICVYHVSNPKVKSLNNI